MRLLYLILITNILSNNLFAGVDSLRLSSNEVYLLELDVIENQFQSSCNCNFESLEDTCFLYKVRINRILLQRDTTLSDSTILKNISYVVSNCKLEIGKKLYLLSNSSSDSYLIATRCVSYDYVIVDSTTIYQVGLTRCKSLSKFQRFLCKIHLCFLVKNGRHDFPDTFDRFIKGR